MSKKDKPRFVMNFTKIITIVLILSAACYIIFASYDPDNDDAETSPILTVNVIEVKKQPSYVTQHTYLGIIEAKRTTNLSFEIPGTVDDILVHEGEKVLSTQPLAQLNTDHLLAKQAEVQAEIERASALHELTRVTKKRTLEASQHQAVSEIDRDQADQNFLAQEASLSGAQARLEQINIEIGKGILLAPYSGVIGRLYIDEGTVVEEGSDVLQLVEIDHLEARMGIKNPLALSVGQDVTIFTRHGPVSGTLSSILPIRESNTRNVEIICKIQSEGIPIRPGDAATMVVDETVEKEGVWLPTSALTASSRGLWAVYIAVPNEGADSYQLVRQELEIIDQTTDQVFVRSPIEDGALVVKNGINKVVPGLSVHIKKGE